MVYVVDGRGRYLLHSDPAREFAVDLGAGGGRLQDEHPALASLLDGAAPSALEVSLNGAPCGVACAPVELTSGSRLLVLSLVPSASAAATAGARRPVLGVAAVVALVAALAALLVARTLTAPLAAVTAAAEALPEPPRRPLPTDRRDEVGTLARALGRTGESLRAQTAALARQERTFRGLIEAAPSAILMVDLSGRIALVNRRTEDVFGYPREELIGRPIEVLIPERWRGGHAELVSGFLTAPESRPMGAGRDLYGLRRDGSEVPVEVALDPIETADGRFVLVTVVDITVRRRHEDELQRRNQELLARDGRMRALTARLNAVREAERTRISREVHDQLGPLLTGVKMDLRWVGRRLAPEASPAQGPVVGRLREAEELLDGTLRAVQRIAIELRPTALDALGLAAAVRDEARRFTERSGVSASVEVEGEVAPGPVVATEVYRVLQELLTNVSRHAAARTVRILLRQVGGELSLRVEDDGVGIPDAAADSPESLGLLGMHERAEALGGTLGLERGAAVGTVATLRAPVEGGA